MARKPEGVEVSVIDERIVVTYPKLNVPYYTAIVTYHAGDALPRTIFLPLSEVAAGREEQLNREIGLRKGDLFNKYLELRTKRIREDMEKVAVFKPEVVRL